QLAHHDPLVIRRNEVLAADPPTLPRPGEVNALVEHRIGHELQRFLVARLGDHCATAFGTRSVKPGNAGSSTMGPYNCRATRRRSSSSMTWPKSSGLDQVCGSGSPMGGVQARTAA